MKNFLILGLLAALLFSVSAGLSLWLNQSKKDAEGEKTAEKEKAGSKNPVKPEAKEPPETHPAPNPNPKTNHAPPAAGAGAEAAAILTDRESRLRLRAEQIDMVLRDLQVERQVVENLLKQVNAELKTATNRTSELEAVAAELERKKVDFSATERQNIAKMAAMYDTMPPENAAPILKQMADTGRMDTAVKILVQMKERQAARVLAELNDAALAAQLLDKMRGLKPPTAAGTAAPAGGVVPAKGP